MFKRLPIKMQVEAGRNPFRKAFVALVLLASLAMSSLPAQAAVFVIDSFDTPVGFTGNPIASIGAGPVVSTNVTGLPLHETVGGSRYYEVDRTSPGGISGESVRAETENIFGFSQFRYISSDGAIGVGTLSYGRFEDLKAVVP